MIQNKWLGFIPSDEGVILNPLTQALPLHFNPEGTPPPPITEYLYETLDGINMMRRKQPTFLNRMDQTERNNLKRLFGPAVAELALALNRE